MNSGFRNYIELLEECIAQRNVLLLHYRSPSSLQRSERDIEPLGVFFTQNSWMLVAFCRLREEKREFRLDGVLSLEKTGDTFPPHQFTFNKNV